jgi:hypothetical protein
VVGEGFPRSVETLDSELETVFEPSSQAEATIAFGSAPPETQRAYHASRLPDAGPPKDDSEDLFVELLED